MPIPLHESVEACGKVILLGEHSVVYGHPAVAAGLPQGLCLRAAPRERPELPITLVIPQWQLALELRADSDHPVVCACLEVLTHCEGPLTGWALHGTTCLPARAGLGSSAALTVALARLVLGQDAPLDEVVAASMAGERVFHGEPSGLDSRVAAQGGVLRFVRGATTEPIPLAGPLPLVLIPSGIPRSTAVQVARVRARLERNPAIIRPLLGALAASVDAGIARSPAPTSSPSARSSTSPTACSARSTSRRPRSTPCKPRASAPALAGPSSPGPAAAAVCSPSRPTTPAR